MNDRPGVFRYARALTDRLSIRRRLVGAIALILSLFGLACVTSIVTFENVHDARVFSQQMTSLLVRTADLDTAMIRQESALRGYVQAGAPRYLQTLAEMRDEIERHLDALGDASAAWPGQRMRLDRIEGLQRQWRNTVADAIIAQIQAGDFMAARDRLIAGASVSILDPMREVLANYRGDVQRKLDASTAELAFRQQRARWILLGVLLFGLIVGWLTVRAVVRRVTEPLSRLTDTTQQLAEGERDLDIAFIERPDEIGAVARALEQFRQIILDQDRQAWIRDHRARLTVLLHRCANERELGERLLAELAPLLGAGYAALFTPAEQEDNQDEDEDQPEKTDRYALLAAYGYCGDPSAIYRPGEGLVGQVLCSRERILVDNVPAHYLPVRSGLGEASPALLLLAPVLAGSNAAGVLEFALFTPPDARVLELLDTLLPNVALSLLNFARSRRTAELLAQSRAQGQALREQQQALRASEEELKVQAEELRATNDELRNRQDLMRAQQKELSALNADAQRRAEALAKASQYKSDFLANMSHELRTPLNSLLILSRSLADNDGGNLDTEQVEAAGIIHESGSNLLALINDILDLSKIEAGKMQVNPERLSVAALCAGIERQFNHVASRKGLLLTVERADDAPETVVTDAGKLEQVVRNLVSNAIKFTERGSVKVLLGRPAPETLSSDEILDADTALAIHVIDDGIGIPADRLDQIFLAFEQVDASTSRTYGGTGLGLSISRELTRLLGGQITVQSRPGEGSRFSVTIRSMPDGAIAHDQPLPPDSIAEPQTPYTASAAAEKGTDNGYDRRAQLLIIDDDTTFSTIVAKAARKRGFECVTAADGETGLDKARQRPPDAIVLDLGLPGMDGWSVLDRLKADERTCDIPVHIVSAADAPDGVKRIGGAVGYLQKPIARSDLDTIFARAEALSGRAARRLLVVDDDHDAHTAIAHLLKQETVEIVAVTCGTDALATLDAQGFDCVVLDLHLPDISGFELLAQIASRTDAPPVVVYSGRELTDEETRSLRTHTDSIVIKGKQAEGRLLDEISLFFHRLSDAGRIPRPAAAPAETIAAAITGRTALVVDDDMRNTFALSRVLRSRGMNVLMASDGFKALDQLDANNTVSVVLMDIMMPKMDGYETIRRIREQTRYAQLPIIALTAKAMPDDREKCLQAGANDYLPKPVDTQALFGLMGSLV